MRRTLRLLASAIFLFPAHDMLAQSVGINSTGDPADNSAILDVTSTSKGVLIPRLTSGEIGSIANPATGLLVYRTTSPAGFYYNSGTPSVPNWVIVQVGTDVTTQGNSFNGSNQLVKLNGSSQLPAVSGGNLTGLDAANISIGTLNAGRLPATATTQGNSFNAANQLVKLDASGRLPAVDGSQITNLPSSGASFLSSEWVANSLDLTYPLPLTPTGIPLGTAPYKYTINQASLTIPAASTMDNLYIRQTFISGSGTTNVTVTLYKNGSATGLGCSFTATTTAGAVGGCSDTAAGHAVTFAAGDTGYLLVTQTSNLAVFNLKSSVRVK